MNAQLATQLTELRSGRNDSVEVGDNDFRVAVPGKQLAIVKWLSEYMR